MVNNVVIVKKKNHKKRSGVIAKKKFNKKDFKKIAINICISLAIVIVIFLACFLCLRVPTLWYQTLIKPKLLPIDVIFLIASLICLGILGVLFFTSINSKDSSQIINLSINSSLIILTFYMFYAFKSSLGAFVLLIALIIQSLTVLRCYAKKNSQKKSALVLLMYMAILFFILWQIYNAFVVYLIFMLN